MREKLIELILNAPKKEVHFGGRSYGRTYQTAGNIADHLLANGVIHIPCKIGDIVYQTDGLQIYELTILDISLRKNKPYYETESVDFDDGAFGKSIFLTREEAEQALKGGEKE